VRRAFVCCLLLPPYTLLATCTIRAGRPYIAVNAVAQCRLHDGCIRCRRGQCNFDVNEATLRLVKKLTSSACRATRYCQRLRTVLYGSPRCTRATMPRQFGVRGFRLGRALDFNMSLHLEELQVYDSLPLGASAYDTCYVCYQYRVHSTPVHVVQARASLRLGRVTGEFMEFLAQMPGSGTCHVIRSECRMCAGYIRVRLPAAAVKRRRGRSWLGVASLNAATNSSCTANLSRRHRHVSP
jgi:hypothetical protein